MKKFNAVIFSLSIILSFSFSEARVTWQGRPLTSDEILFDFKNDEQKQALNEKLKKGELVSKDKPFLKISSTTFEDHDFSNMYLKGVHFYDCTFINCNFSNTDFRDVQLDNVDVNMCHFKDAILYHSHPNASEEEVAKNGFRVKDEDAYGLFCQYSDLFKNREEPSLEDKEKAACLNVFLRAVCSDLSNKDFKDFDLRDINLSNGDLRNIDFTRANLQNAKFNHSKLKGANLIGNNLQNAELNGADLVGANLSGANLQNASLAIAHLVGANLSGADLQDANLFKAYLKGANLTETNLYNASLACADLSNAILSKEVTLPDFSIYDRGKLYELLFKGKPEECNQLQRLFNARYPFFDKETSNKELKFYLEDMKLKRSLRNSDLCDLDLRGINLSGADLQHADLSKTNLEGANLSNANLQNAGLHYTNLKRANLSNANLQNTFLNSAHLEGANLSNANLQNASLSKTHLVGANLSNTKLQKARLYLPNDLYRGIEIPNYSEGDLTELFELWFNGTPDQQEVCQLLVNCEFDITRGVDRQRVIEKILTKKEIPYLDLRDVLFQEKDLQGYDFHGCNLGYVDLRGLNLESANLKGAHLINAHLEKANLNNANLEDADLTGAKLVGSTLRGACLIAARLTYADLNGSDLSGADLQNAELMGVNLEGAMLKNAQFGGAKLSFEYVLPPDCKDEDLLEIYASCQDGSARSQLRFILESKGIKLEKE